MVTQIDTVLDDFMCLGTELLFLSGDPAIDLVSQPYQARIPAYEFLALQASLQMDLTVLPGLTLTLRPALEVRPGNTSVSLGLGAEYTLVVASSPNKKQ